MTKARKTQVSLEDTTYYHAISRVVRRAFLCGTDEFSGRNYEHRRQWIVDRLKELSAVYAIDVCAYAVLSNHFHLVLHINKEEAEAWSDHEVVERWGKLHKLSPLVSRFINGESMTAAELRVVSVDIETWRVRLYDISWFMRGINEFIARKANQEDGCTGRFWEGRFKSQALLDDAAILTCMSYVDLNPVRAGMAETLEASDFTSIQERIKCIGASIKEKQAEQHADGSEVLLPTPEGLMPFTGGEHIGKAQGIPFDITDYLALTDWTGRAIRDDKKGAVPSRFVPILERLNINPDMWLDNILHYRKHYFRAVGSTGAIRQYCQTLEQQWLCGMSAAQQMYKVASAQ